MASRKKAAVPQATPPVEWLAQLASDAPIAGVSGPGRWLVAEYHHASLFALKLSLATSAGGRTLLVPTPYSIKMALVDAAFRCAFTDEECAALLRHLVPIDLRISPPARAVVTSTFLKIRQEPKTPSELEPFISAIAFREVVQFHGSALWAFDLTQAADTLVQQLIELLPAIRSIGQRGSFVQFLGVQRRIAIDAAFTKPLDPADRGLPESFHAAPLDDFGPEASLEVLSSYTAMKPKRDKHRKFVQTVVPLGCVNAGPGFTEWRRG